MATRLVKKLIILMACFVMIGLVSMSGLRVPSAFAINGPPAINLASGILNPTFTGTPGTCPAQWICAGSPAPGFSSYNPGAAQYPGGHPFPTSAFSPTVYGGSGVIRQLTTLTWTSGVNYVLDVFAGLPLKEPDGITPVAGWPGSNGAARLYLTMGDGFGQVAAFDIPSPAPGTWVVNPIILNLPANSPAIGQKIGVMIYVSAPSGFSANFDFAGPV
jgi:hypothetical protein